MNTVRTITTGQVQAFDETFDAALGSPNWTHPSWTLRGESSQELPSVQDGRMRVLADTNNWLSTALLADKMMSTESYREVYLHEWRSYTLGASYLYLMMDMDDSSPDPLVGGLLAAFTYTNPLSNIQLFLHGELIVNQNIANSIPIGTFGPQTIRMSVDASSTVRVYWPSVSVPAISYNLGTYPAIGGRVGFGVFLPTNLNVLTADGFTARYFTSSGNLPEVAMVGANNGIVYYESTNGNMVQVNSNLRTLTDEWISAANRLDRLYIADHGVKSQNDTGSATTATSTLTDAGATFTTDGVDADDDMVEIVSASDATKQGTYPIVTVDSETAITVTGTLGTMTGVVYRVMRAPKVFDSEDLTLTRLTASAGFIPPDCDIVAVFNDRLCWAGDGLVPEAVYMSKSGDPTDYNYGEGLVDEAFVFDPARQSGAPFIGDKVTALIPHLDDYLIIGCKRSIWFQRADPALGANPEPISREIGILKQSAWCYTPEGAIVAMTLDGLYLIAPGANTAPQRLSRDRMPQELVNIDINLNDVLVEYDTLRNGINIFVTPRNPAPTQHFWFGWQLKEFSPESYNSDFEPTAIVSHALGGVGPRRVVLGCRDGYLRVHENSAHTDDGENFHSNVLIGPIMLGGGGYYEGMIREVVGQLAVDSGAVTMKIRIGDSVESAYNASSRVSYTMRAGKNRTWRPNLRGNACFIELSSEGGAAWAFEQLSIVRERLGKQRLLA